MPTDRRRRTEGRSGKAPHTAPRGTATPIPRHVQSDSANAFAIRQLGSLGEAHQYRACFERAPLERRSLFRREAQRMHRTVPADNSRAVSYRAHRDIAVVAHPLAARRLSASGCDREHAPSPATQRSWTSLRAPCAVCSGRLGNRPLELVERRDASSSASRRSRLQAA